MWNQVVTLEDNVQAFGCDHSPHSLQICVRWILFGSFWIQNVVSQVVAELWSHEAHKAEFAEGLTYFGMEDKRQGIVHVIGPEQAGPSLAAACSFVCDAGAGVAPVLVFC